MTDRTRLFPAIFTLFVSLLAFGLASACGTTTEGATATADPVDAPADTAETAEDTTTTEAVAEADTLVAQADEDVVSPSTSPCEGVVGSVRTELKVPSTVGEYVVAAFDAEWIDDKGYPTDGAKAAAQFSAKPEPDSYWELAPVPAAEGADEATVEGATEGADEATTPAPTSAGEKIFAPGYRLCLDEGEYVVVAFLDANNDGRIWTTGDHHGTATVTVPTEAVVSLDVFLTDKVPSGLKKRGEGNFDSPPPEGPGNK